MNSPSKTRTVVLATPMSGDIRGCVTDALQECGFNVVLGELSPRAPANVSVFIVDSAEVNSSENQTLVTSSARPPIEDIYTLIDSCSLIIAEIGQTLDGSIAFQLGLASASGKQIWLLSDGGRWSPYPFLKAEIITFAHSADGLLQLGTLIRQLADDGGLVNSLEKATSSVKPAAPLKDVRAEISASEISSSAPNEDWRTLAAIAAHKLGNPLYAIETAAETLSHISDIQSPDATTLFAAMRSAIERAKHIVSQLKKLYTANRMSPSSGDLSQLVEIWTKHATAQLIKINLNAEPHITAMFDANQFPCVLDELLDNCHACCDKSQLEILLDLRICPGQDLPAALKLKHYARLTISDNGPGVPSALKEDIFRPLVTTRKTGSGLGLAIVDAIVKAHGGIVREVGVEKLGATFEVFIPAEASLEADSDGDNPIS